MKACSSLFISLCVLLGCSSDDSGDGASGSGGSGPGAGSGGSGTASSSAATGPAGAGAAGGGGAAGVGGSAADGGAGGASVGQGGGGGAPANACEACFQQACPSEWTDCQADPSGYCVLFLPAYYQCVEAETACCETYAGAGPAAQAMVDCWTEECAADCPCP